MISRHFALGSFAVVSLLLSACRSLPPSDQFPEQRISYQFFADGKAKCRVILPEKAEKEELEAGELLTDTFAKMGGVKITIVREPADPAEGIDIHLGATRMAIQGNYLPADMDQDGFAIVPVDEKNLVLVGKRPVSSYYAATELLERYGDVLWVRPGPHGTEIPKRTTLTANVRKQLSQPLFVARKFSGISGKMANFRIHQTTREIRSRFHHNIHPHLTTEMFASHPEYFSLVEGKRRKPTSNRSNWQACTSNPEVVEVFANAARDLFKKTPWCGSFSVSQNDGGGFCECENCRALDIPGVEGISDRYYTFVNQVADKIREDCPGKRIACLAYGTATRDVPVRVKLRENTMIYAVVPTLRDVHEDIKKWKKAAPRLGVYFWIHGKTVPKFYPHRWAKYLQFLYRNHVREVYAEVYPDYAKNRASWALDTPRVWFTAKLLWNPNADVDELLERFCRIFHGPAAAPMLRYYRQCEIAWERRDDVYDFGKSWRSPEYELYTLEDLTVMKAALAEAAKLAAGNKTYAARVAEIQNPFSLAGNTIELVGISKLLAERPLKTRGDAEKIVGYGAELESLRRQLSSQEKLSYGVLPGESETAIDDCFDKITALLGDHSIRFWEQQLAAQPLAAPYINGQLLRLRGNSENLADNPSFEQLAKPEAGEKALNWGASQATGWGTWIRPGTRGSIRVTTNCAHSGKYALELDNVEAACGIKTRTSVTAGERYRISCWVKTNGQSDNPKRATLTVKWQSKEGKWISGAPEIKRTLPQDSKEWSRLSISGTVPKGIGRLVVLLGAGNLHQGEKTCFDDFSLERLTPPPVEN